jgi:long-chain acyl-CoA synthetase
MTIDRTVLLTGATGSLGTQVALSLLRETAHNIVVLVRAKDKEAANHRLSRAWWDWPELVEAIGSRVRVLVGDVSEPKLGLGDPEYGELVYTLTHIIHAAADLRLNAPVGELRRANVEGTANILKLAHAVHGDHGLERLSYVSTAYVAGGRRGAVSENSLTDECGFWSKYELSKYEGETLVQQAKGELPISVFRPGLVVGDSKTGAIKTFNTIYFPIRLYFSRKPILIPVNPSMRINIVPVDYVAEAIVRLTFLPQAKGLNFHLVAPWEKLPTAREFIQFLRDFAKSRMGIKMPRPVFSPMPIPANRARYKAQGMLGRGLENVIAPLLTIVPYFNERRRFLRDNVDRLLGPYDFRWQEVLLPVVEFAVSKGFMHRSERTIHEQILFRLQSRSLPIVYHDIVDGKVVAYETKVVRSQMLSAAAALMAMGIKKGDRVAIVGSNSTRYLIVDVAIGLAGAVSVPLYNTCPSPEIAQILDSSSAKVLFVGTPSVLECLDELAAEIPVVSFCRQETQCQLHRKVISWEQFLARGNGHKMESTAPVGFGDVATIRYTSGTTSQMKGACFDHQNLRWIADSVCSVMNSWRALGKEFSYLSYLPMSHVVEGVLATYSPYYTRASFQIYFLEDIHGLLPALQKVRPHMFFSVPRFYEKVLEALLKSRLARSYFNTSEGLRRRLLRHILSHSILRKTGLNRCHRLVVGSAPSSEALLRKFQELGIEIYNAYGLTEAPLVTINPLGANRVATVGEPIPGTELCTAVDGEIMVRGPQVARGYLAGETFYPFKEGWLSTGDLGNVTSENSLVLKGRKKEVIVTSYGKNIYPTEIESMLRAISDVNEAMLLGDDRPFCAAILWVSPDGSMRSLIDYTKQAIAEINRQLSHPEQVKRWAILEDELSIERGEMTASLKLKRDEVTLRFAHVVDALYSKTLPALSGVIHIGSVDEKE